ncbi:MAG: sulfurtransferase TusA family protein [Pseudomonadota bacterium]
MDNKVSPDDQNLAAELDARGLLCPLPVLKLRKRLEACVTGDLFKIMTDDPAAVLDVPHFCAEQGHKIISQVQIGGHCVFVIEKS